MRASLLMLLFLSSPAWAGLFDGSAPVPSGTIRAGDENARLFKWVPVERPERAGSRRMAENAPLKGDGAAVPPERTLIGSTGSCGPDLERNIIVCEIISYGTRYIIPDDGTSELEVLLEFSMLPPDSGITARVSILEEGKDATRVALLGFEESAQYEHERIGAALQGRWSDVTGSGAGILVEGNRLVDTLMGGVLKRASYQVAWGCFGLPGPQVSLRYDDGAQVCWEILDLTSDRLHLRHAQDRTEIIYEKSQ